MASGTTPPTAMYTAPTVGAARGQMTSSTRYATSDAAKTRAAIQTGTSECRTGAEEDRARRATRIGVPIVSVSHEITATAVRTGTMPAIDGQSAPWTEQCGAHVTSGVFKGGCTAITAESSHDAASTPPVIQRKRFSGTCPVGWARIT